MQFTVKAATALRLPLLIGISTWICTLLFRQRKKAKGDISNLRKALKQERDGRIAAEKQLGQVMQETLCLDDGYYMQPIGELRSCFTNCIGTPRQGHFAPSSRGKIVLSRNISPTILDGLESFSHVWLVFVFHKNTNVKKARAHTNLLSDSIRHTFPSKVTPPKLKKRIGIFSTRSPHRPNPIGFTLATIDQIKSNTRELFISAIDLIDGTPILDIKPYVAVYDSVPDALAPDWILENVLAYTSQTVLWKDDNLRSQALELARKTELYRNDPESFISAINEVLLADVRSKHQTDKMRESSNNVIVLENVDVHFRLASSPCVSIEVIAMRFKST